MLILFSFRIATMLDGVAWTPIVPPRDRPWRAGSDLVKTSPKP
ncbi:hypothetical protein [Mycetocola zhujimingii]|nr:hypothetical protein [Mycetocola zhujimingii]